MMFLRHLLPLSALVLTAADPNKQIPLGGEDVSLCEHPDYKVHIVSRSPFVMYIENFITGEERAHLRDITYVKRQCSMWVCELTERHGI